MSKFLLCVGAEKAGTTWLYDYFARHPDYYDPGKELNVIQRDDFVPSFHDVDPFKKNLETYFEFFKSKNMVSGDFTHYEGSTENIFRMIKGGFARRDIEVVPVYIMRDPIQRAWSAYNMLGGGYDLTMPPAASFVMKGMLSCKYEETVKALDNVFSEPLYFFYETFFEQKNIDTICDRLNISSYIADTNRVVNGAVPSTPTPKFVNEFGSTGKTKRAVRFIAERFDNVPWELSLYS